MYIEKLLVLKIIFKGLGEMVTIGMMDKPLKLVKVRVLKFIREESQGNNNFKM